MEYKFLLESVNNIALEAGKIILEVYNNLDDFEISKKEDESPLTIADRSSNDFICKELSKLEIKFPIISEENAKISYDIRKNYEFFWLVDPLDGTKEFIKRNGEFTVNIALVNKTIPVLGVIYTPCLNELYWAVKGEGAFQLKQSIVSRLSVNQFKLSDKNLKVVASKSHLNVETKALIDKLDHPQIISKGSSLKFMMLASGEADYYPRLSPTMEWDTAAAQVILEEAGGKITQFDGSPMIYNKENLLNPFFIAIGQEG
jgi:3'(2'), 5'-bisphosphate nucleotidase